MLEIATELPYVRLKQLSTHRDDLLYFNLVELNREHLSRYGLDTSYKYPDFQSVEEARKHPKNLYRLRMGIWAVGRFIGSANFTPDKTDLSIGDVGFWLAENWTGYGYATISVNAIANHARYTGFSTITAHVADPANEPAIAVLDRAGFEDAGTEQTGELVYHRQL